MEIKINPAPRGSVLVVGICTAGIIGLGLATYLWLVSSHNFSVMRSLAWNSALTIAEAGAEEALTQTQYTSLDQLSSNNWANLNNGWFYKKRYMDGVSYYEVLIQQVDPPVIISTATVSAPVSALRPTSTYGLMLGATTPAAAAVVKRRIQVNTRRRPIFLGAMIADEHVDLSGNGISTDGFDSGTELWSTLGKWDPTKVKASGDVACNASATKVVDLGNAKIMGHAATGPGGLAYMGSNASVGSVAWVSGGNKGPQDTTWVTDDAHFDISSVPNPAAPGGWSTGYAASLLGTNFVGGLPGESTYYKLSSFGGKVVVTGDVTIWVTSSISFGSGDSIYISPGSNLKLYVGDQSGPDVSATMSGIGNSGLASAFQYYGLPTNKSLGFQANAAYTGTIYAPQADFSLGGGGNDSYDFSGACVVKTAKMNGHFHFHFDEALKRNLWRGYVAAKWNELDPNAPLN